MKYLLPDDIVSIYKQVDGAGFEVYFIGGCVRDLVMGIPVKDWDLTTNATPEQIQKLFPDSYYDNSYGTVGVPIEKDGETILVAEITTFRTEEGFENFRHPTNVTWGKTLSEDVKRRDFTVNTLALKISGDEHEIIDTEGGLKDLENKIIRAVGNPNERFKEDALRMLRAVRFATQFAFTIDEKTRTAIKTNSNLLKHISGERIRIELLKILGSNYPYEGIMLLDNLGLLELILPELTRGKGISQERPGRHHKDDVFTHNVLSLKYCPSVNPLVRFATLLHDVGKPEVEAVDEKGFVIFYNHEVAGAKIAKDISDRLHFSKKDREKIYTLIRWHMFTIDEHITDSAIRRFIRRVGVENVADMIDLRIGDRLGGGTQFAESWRLKKFKERLSEQLNPPFSINDLSIDGNDIMRELNIEPGREVGDILQTLFEEVDENLELNNRKYLIQRVSEIKKNKV